MHDAPSPSELIASVKRFIDEAAAPQLTGHAAFHARVASNVLATLLRELEQRPTAEHGEAERLRKILSATADATVGEMNRDLCERIRDGRMDAATPGLFQHLKTTTIDQLSIDQPNYSGLEAARSRLG
ncbi:DUF6285 domain-containing protein [Hyphomonas sp.]|uniref:DUF6285 domain-containing protein n=1 Tax=Hyphomonas sp. TaxID=87 RepID=UPI0032EBA400|tara:strand:- start:49409 stop:49792 length:384 start_codon:yes stop_codon:yes gene_type:complete